MIKTHCRENLFQIKNLLQQLTLDAYKHPRELLSGASIGAHVRHVLEFYTCLLNNDGVVNYDKRERNQEVENSPQEAINLINRIIDQLNLPHNDQEITIEGVYSSANEKAHQFKTSLYREFAYCLEHSIHHQALIKISLIELGLNPLVDENFGLAPATILYKAACVQ